MYTCLLTPEKILLKWEIFSVQFTQTHTHTSVRNGFGLFFFSYFIAFTFSVVIWIHSIWKLRAHANQPVICFVWFFNLNISNRMIWLLARNFLTLYTFFGLYMMSFLFCILVVIFASSNPRKLHWYFAAPAPINHHPHKKYTKCTVAQTQRARSSACSRYQAERLEPSSYTLEYFFFFFLGMRESIEDNNTATLNVGKRRKRKRKKK